VTLDDERSLLQETAVDFGDTVPDVTGTSPCPSSLGVPVNTAAAPSHSAEDTQQK